MLKVTYKREIDYFGEAADLLTRSRAFSVEQGCVLTDFSGILQSLTERYHPSPEIEAKLKRHYKSLADVAEKALSKIGNISAEKAEFYFEPRFQGFFGAAGLVSQVNAYAVQQGKSFFALSEAESKEAELVLANSVIDFEEDPLFAGEPSAFDILEHGLEDDGKKWFCYRLIRNLKDHMRELIEILEPVMEALRGQEAILRPLHEDALSRIQQRIEQEGAGYLKRVYHISPEEKQPLVISASLMRPLDYSFYHTPKGQVATVGVTTEWVLALKEGGLPQEKIVDMLKTLGDKRRMEILTLLKERSYFGQELAEKLSLTPATISHHMNLLMQNRLITLEHDGNRMLYSLSKEDISRLLESLRRELLG